MNDNYREKREDLPLTDEEIKQWIKEGYPISGGGGIPSDYAPKNKYDVEGDK